MLTMKRPRTLSHRHKLNARSLREIVAAMKAAVRDFADDGRIKFRGRQVGNEAYINAAVWYLADQDRATQERILRAYLPRIEAFLAGDDLPVAEINGAGAAHDASEHAGSVAHSHDPKTGRRAIRGLDRKAQ